jgi:hypothetical protein
MSPGVPSSPEAVTAAIDQFDAAQADVAALPFQVLRAHEALAVKDRLETISRRQAAVDHRLTSQLTPKPARSSWAPSHGPTCCATGCASVAAKPADGWMKPTT